MLLAPLVALANDRHGIQSSEEIERRQQGKHSAGHGSLQRGEMDEDKQEPKNKRKRNKEKSCN